MNTAFTVNPSDPSDLKLTPRYKIANRIKQANPDKKCIFLSIHVNAAGNGAKWMTGTGVGIHDERTEQIRRVRRQTVRRGG